MINITKAESVIIQREIDKIMEKKAKEILDKNKEKNVILKLIMENRINNYSVEQIKNLFAKKRS